MKKKRIIMKVLELLNKFSLVSIGCGICVVLEISKNDGLAIIVLSIIVYLFSDIQMQEIIDDMVH